AESWFEVIGAGDVVPAKKPAPDIYYYTLERLRLPASACLAFEDSENGVRAARAASLKTVVTVNDYTRTHDFSGAAIVLDHLGEANQPFKILSSTPVNGFAFVNLDFLLQLHAAA
ncbi:MAG: HAD-IA family hydrolase, partial [Pseudomonadota bacterium]